MFSEHVQSGRGAQRAHTRARVVDSAQRLFLARGFRGTTVRDIAADADVSVGTVMAVGDKDALLLGAFDRWVGAVHDEWEAGARPLPDGGDPAARIGSLVQPFLDLFNDRIELTREYGAIFARGAGQAEVFTGLAVKLTAEFTAVLADAGLGRHAEAGGRAVYASYLGLLMAHAALAPDLSGVRAQLEEVVTVLVRPDES